MYHLHNQCRACGNKELTPAFDLGIMPLANDYKTAGEEHEGFAPLEVLFCERCRLPQLSVVVRPDILYGHYTYRTSDTQMMANHLKTLYGDLKWECPMERVLEIGSNDGLLLKRFREWGTRDVLGIDPAANLVKIANADGVHTVCGYFDGDAARMAVQKFGNPDCIIARHVFCHIDEWRGVIQNIDSICGPNTAIYIEAPYILDTLRVVGMDQFYHEHLSYLCLSALDYLVRDSRLQISSARFYKIQGGALGVVLTVKGLYQDRPSLQGLFAAEREELTLERWRQFTLKARNNFKRLASLVRDLTLNGKTIAGYGATAKSSIWIHSCGLDETQIKYVVDGTDLKQGKLCPGSRIPIVDPSILKKSPPDYLLLFAWNYEAEILAKEQEYRDKGGKFILIVPEVKVV